MPPEPLERVFPRLAESSYLTTSRFDRRYNCFAWAAGDNTKWWEPDPWGGYYWPPTVPRQYSVAAFCAAFGTLGYRECESVEYNATEEKVALFCKNGVPTHAARQLDSGLWTSKLGQDVDISHELNAISGNAYGEAVVFLARPKQA